MPKKWDCLDISMLVESALDSFAVEFYGCGFDQLKDGQVARIIGALREQVVELDEACKDRRKSKKAIEGKE